VSVSKKKTWNCIEEICWAATTVSHSQIKLFYTAERKKKTGEKFANKKRLKFKNKLVLAGIFICVNNLMFRIITEHCPMSSKYSYFRYIFISLSRFTLCRTVVISDQRCYMIKITWHTKKQGFASIIMFVFLLSDSMIMFFCLSLTVVKEIYIKRQITIRSYECKCKKEKYININLFFHVSNVIFM
jgi:hypothetical protein